MRDIVMPPRTAEYWEQVFEIFPGATVLDDLERHGHDEAAAKWIIVRYAAVRAAALLLLRDAQAPELAFDRSIGLNHLRAMPTLDREAWSLKKMLYCVRPDPPREVALGLLTAGDVAARRGHDRGAFAMFLLAYRLAVPRGWHREAGLAARGIERLAAAAGAVHSPRLWRRRARVMEARTVVA